MERFANGSSGLTRLAYAFSKKWDNLKAALAIYVAHYNFCRVHQTLRVTPAMAAGVTNRLWEVSDLVALLVESESKEVCVRGARLAQWLAGHGERGDAQETLRSR